MLPLQSGDPQVLGRYVLIARLGSGGMGEVFLGRTRGGRTVAVKAVKPELASNPDFRRRFRREVDAARLVSGRHTAPVVDADPDAPVPWLATAFVSGPTLREVVDDGWRLPESSLAVLAGGLARALTEIHAAGIVHRDLKPSNVMLAVDGPRVIDFGISRVLGAASDLTRTDVGVLVGSVTFMSPEQAQARELTPATDVFSLGAVLAFAATGRSPFSGGGEAAVLYRIVHAEPNLAEMPAGLSALVADCLAKDPEERPTPAQVIERTARAVEDGAWLPAALTASIAQTAAEILDYEGAADFPEVEENTPWPGEVGGSNSGSGSGGVGAAGVGVAGAAGLAAAAGLAGAGLVGAGLVGDGLAAGGAGDGVAGGAAGDALNEAGGDANLPPTTVLPSMPGPQGAPGGGGNGVGNGSSSGNGSGVGGGRLPSTRVIPPVPEGVRDTPQTRVLPTIPPGVGGSPGGMGDAGSSGWPGGGGYPGVPLEERVAVGRPPEPGRSSALGVLIALTMLAIVAALAALVILALKAGHSNSPGPTSGTTTLGSVSQASKTSVPTPTPTSSASSSSTPTPTPTSASSSSSSASPSPTDTGAASTTAEPTTSAAPTSAVKTTDSAPPSSAAGTAASG